MMDTRNGNGNENGEQQETPGKRRISKSRRVILEEVKTQKPADLNKITETKAQPLRQAPTLLEGKGNNPFLETHEKAPPTNKKSPVSTPQRVSQNAHGKTELYTVDETSPVETTKSAKFFSQPEVRRQFHNEAQKSKAELFKISEQKSRENKRLQQTQDQVDEVVGIMAKNVDKIKEREIKLEEAERRAENLLLSSKKFQKTTEMVKKKYWWADMKMKIILGICIFLLLLAIGGAAVYFGLN